MGADTWPAAGANRKVASLSGKQDVLEMNELQFDLTTPKPHEAEMLRCVDRLSGVDAIAAYLGCTHDGVYYARRIGSLPIRRLGRKGELYAFKSELDAVQKADSTLPEKWSGDLRTSAS